MVTLENALLKTKKFTTLLKNPQGIQAQEIVSLKKVVQQFPYFQSARALYLKGLKTSDSFKYNHELKITAAHTTDRTVLFHFISSKDFNASENIHQQIASLSIKDSKYHALETTTELHPESPLSFTPTETHSFGQWLQLSAKKPIIRTLEKKERNNTLIDRFIQNNPKITPLSKTGTQAPVAVAKISSNELMTETLAKVYLAQHKYENAIQAYSILSLKNPEKSGFFADQIKRIRILQKNK